MNKYIMTLGAVLVFATPDRAAEYSLLPKGCVLLENTVSLDVPFGYQVYSEPSRKSELKKSFNGVEAINVIGYLDGKEGRFFISDWSFDQVKVGKKPNWIWVKSEGGEHSWRSRVVSLQGVRRIWCDAHLVKKMPSLSSRNIKIVSEPSYVNVAGYIDTDEGRFYISDWSWDRIRSGHEPNWMFIYVDDEEPSASSYVSSERFTNQSESSYATSEVSESEIYAARILTAALGYAVNSAEVNPVIAAGAGEIVGSFIEGREISPGEIVEATAVNALTQELRAAGYGDFADFINAIDAFDYIINGPR